MTLARIRNPENLQPAIDMTKQICENYAKKFKRLHPTHVLVWEMPGNSELVYVAVLHEYQNRQKELRVLGRLAAPAYAHLSSRELGAMSSFIRDTERSFGIDNQVDYVLEDYDDLFKKEAAWRAKP